MAALMAALSTWPGARSRKCPHEMFYGSTACCCTVRRAGRPVGHGLAAGPALPARIALTKGQAYVLNERWEWVPGSARKLSAGSAGRSSETALPATST